jgi:hypothetical protein
VRRVGALLLVLASTGGATAATVAAASHTTSPKALRHAIFSVARAQRSVHYVVSSVGSSGNVTIVGDAAARRGVQRIMYENSGRSGRATVLVAARTAYLRGDAFTLRGFLGFTKAQAKRYAHAWISVLPTSRAYHSLAAAVTLGSLLTEIYPQADLTLARTKLHGRRLIGVRGAARHDGVPFVEIVFARAHGSRLPVEELETALQTSFRSRTVFGPWNGKVPVHVPAHAVPFSGGSGGGTQA